MTVDFLKFKLGIFMFTVWVALHLVPPALAVSHTVRTQGLVNHGGNLKAGYLLINEMRIYIDGTTRVMDQREIPVSLAELKPKKWVYLEMEKDGVQNIFCAKKIYLLPHYVKPDQRRRFSFMK